MPRKTRNSAASPPAAETNKILEPKRILVVAEKDRKIRKRALELFKQPSSSSQEQQQQQDLDDSMEQPDILPSASSLSNFNDDSNGSDTIELSILYAALKRIQEIGHGPAGWPPKAGRTITTHEPDTDLTEDDLELIRDAALAVPYLMYKKVYEGLMLPRTMGGLAFSDAKAKQVARLLFVGMGTACCGENVTEQVLVSKCSKKGTDNELKRQEARKILPLLKQVGREARSQVEQVYAQLEEGLDDDDNGAGGNGMNEGNIDDVEIEPKDTIENDDEEDSVIADQRYGEDEEEDDEEPNENIILL